ncbi:hypothetical protein D3C71_20320 [compost metagenome]
MLRRFFRSISSVLVVALIATSIPSPGRVAWAQAAVCNALSAERGEQAGCAAVRLEGGGGVVAYPKIQWEWIADAPAPTNATGSAVVSSPEAVTLANRSAVALGVNSNEVASAIQMFPSNVPLVFARYNPMELTLRIDLFKLEKATRGSETRAGLYHATFTPAHGDFWKASRAYIDPARQADGNVAGLNPFARFTSSNPAVFQHITVAGAQVAVGHAMRYVRAPLAVLAVADARYTQRTEKSGNAFRKKTKTIVTAHVKSSWMIAYPQGFQSRSTSMPMATYCANDPAASSCPAYQVASSGVVFEEFEGGTLSGFENQWDVWEKTQSGLGFLAVLAIAVILSFTLAGALAAAGIGAGAAGAGATGVAVGGSASAATAATGLFGTLIGSVGVTGFTTATAIAFESAIVGSLMMLGGANLSSMMHFSPSAVYGDVNVVAGYTENPDLDKIQRPTSERVQPLTVSDFSRGAPALTGFEQTVVGDKSGCAIGKALSDCVGTTGVILRQDQYVEQNQVQFLRDNGGRIIRNDSPVGPALPVQQ